MNTEIKLNIFENMKSTSTFKLMEVKEVIELIKNGDEDKAFIEAARSTGKESKFYKIAKDNRPVVSWNSTLCNGRKITDFEALTGLLYFDKDKLNQDEIKAYKSMLMALPYVFAVWVSFGGKGLGCLINIEGISKENFLSVWQQINDTIGIGFDDKVKSIANMNVISYDPEIEVNYSATPFPFINNEENKTVSNTNYSFVSDSTCLKENTIEVQSDNIYTKTCLYNHTAPFITTYTSNISHHTIFPKNFFDGTGYKTVPETVAYYKVNTFIKFTEGTRNQGMYAIASNLFMANPGRLKQEILQEMYKLNKTQCKPPLLSSEINKIVNSCEKQYREGTLQPTPGKRTIVFDETYPWILREKRKIIGKEMAKLRIDRTKNLILDAIKTLQMKGNLIRQKDVAATIDKSIRTVKKYWNEFKERVTVHNRSLAKQ